MSEHPEKKEKRDYLDADVSDEDIYAAMKEIPGYLDITPGDFREVYQTAYRHALKRITGSVKARDIMTKKVFSVRRSAPLEEVADMLAREKIAGAPVIDENGKVAGVISEKDFLSRMGIKDPGTFMGVIAQCLKGKGCVAISIRAKKAEDIMTSPAITVSEDTPLQKIAGIFTEKNINRVPVTDSKGRLTGIVSRADILRYLPFKEKE
ncbi:MAG: CBS domain-containing protein [Nitrospiraceae bacterium]|nr:MAG: CBS domain-containing protein [Nitrospiraceae bacterium]